MRDAGRHERVAQVDERARPRAQRAQRGVDSRARARVYGGRRARAAPRGSIAATKMSAARAGARPRRRSARSPRRALGGRARELEVVPAGPEDDRVRREPRRHELVRPRGEVRDGRAAIPKLTTGACGCSAADARSQNSRWLSPTSSTPPRASAACRGRGPLAQRGCRACPWRAAARPRAAAGWCGPRAQRVKMSAGSTGMVSR